MQNYQTLLDAEDLQNMQVMSIQDMGEKLYNEKHVDISGEDWDVLDVHPMHQAYAHLGEANFYGDEDHVTRFI